MKKIFIRFAVLMVIIGTVFSFPITASALSWDGSSTGGGGGGTPGGSTGYAVRNADVNSDCVGYRFSVVDKNGGNKGKVIDVFRNSNAYNNNNTFNSKLNKKQLINNQNNSFGTSKSTSNCFMQANMGFAADLPAPSGMGAWQNNMTNLNSVLSALNVGNVNNLTNGDKVLVEPLWDVRLQSVYHSLTVTEIAIYGKWLLGANSNGGTSTTPATWGFISTFTNRNYPNALYTPDGQGLWTGVSAIGSSTRATFQTIINQGYGAGIAYTETKPDFTPVLSVNLCEAWRGSRGTRSHHYGTSRGAAFGNYTAANNYPVMNDTIWFTVHFPAETQNISVRQRVRLQGGSWNDRAVTLSSSSSSQWFDVSLSPATVNAGRSSYIIEARMDWMNGSTVLKTGTVKTFYVPVRPKINRHQVTYSDILNTQVARNGANGSSGSLYVGQRVNGQYAFTSSSTWTSNNNFSATQNGTSDVSFTSNISSSSTLTRNSSRTNYRVPNLTSLPHVLTTSWNSDNNRTRENTTINIPVIKADAELKEIRLIDADTGARVTGNKLWVHQRVTPQYVYKNNTNVRIFVDGFDNDRAKINTGTSVYAIPANSEITVNGKILTIPNNATSFSVWGGVFLEGAGINQTGWESNGTNNTRTVSYIVEHPMTIQPVTPNSNYRENTEVVTSFRIFNGAHFGLRPTHNITVRFTALTGTTVRHTATKSAIIPANGDNLVYFKWTVPSGLNGANFTLRGEIIDGGRVIETREMSRTSEPLPTSQTPDTVFEKNAPSGFSVVSIPTRTGVNSAQWQEWFYENNAFVRRTYGLQLTAAAPALEPDVNAPSRAYTSGRWQIRSGYGFTANWNVGLQTLTGTTAPTTVMRTDSQLAMLYFPEFRYAATTGNFRVLNRTAANVFQLPTNANARNNARLHFTPLWFPNGNYQTQGFVTDIWTPAGMMSGYMNSNIMTVSGTSYDDWYVRGNAR